MKSASLVLAVFAALAAACDDVAAPEDSGSILLSFGKTADTIDTVGERPVQLIVVGGGGLPLGHTWVDLHNKIDDLGNEISDGPKVYATGGTLYTTNEGRIGSGEAVRTNGSGVASVYLRIGREAGTGYIKAVYGEYRDSVEFDALPGAAVGLGAIPADTAVLVGADYPLTVVEIDRWGNHLPTPALGATAVSSEPGVAILDGSTVAARSAGRATIELSSAALSGHAQVSVVPDFLLANGTINSRYVPTVAPSLVAADGSPADPIDGVAGSCPAWHPDGDRLLFNGLRLVTLTGVQTPLATGNPGLIPGCGRFSADGQWVYFDGRLSTDTATASQVWRVRPDGTGLEQITYPATGSQAWSASPSPDGSQIVFIAGVPHGSGDLVVHTLATGAQDTIMRDMHLSRAAWSPIGEWIAYSYYWGDMQSAGRTLFWSDRVALVRPDGTHHPVLAGTAGTLHPSVFGNGGVNWSPDGNWLVGMSPYPDLRVKLIDVATGQSIPLNSATRGFYQPAWQP